jgi:TRAP-type C4-dicarboxylate transport system permease small subunit
MMKLLRYIDRGLARVEGWLIVIFLSLMVCFTFFHVILRALYTHAHIQWANAVLGYVDWTEPFVRLLVLWITFLGASLITGENKHIKIDLMPAIFPSHWLPFRELLLSLVCVLISALMLKASIDYIKIEMDFGGHLFLNVPTWIGELILPAGFSMILFRFFLRGTEQVLEILRVRGAKR